MRSAALVPVALSLALHACAVLAMSHLDLPRRGASARHDPTIGLMVLPTVQPSMEPPQTSASAEAMAPAELKPDDAALPVSPGAPIPEVRTNEAVPQASAQTPSQIATADLPAQLSAATSGPLLAPLGPAAAPDPKGGTETDAPRRDPGADPPEKTLEAVGASEVPEGLAAETQQSPGSEVPPAAAAVGPDQLTAQGAPPVPAQGPAEATGDTSASPPPSASPVVPRDLVAESLTAVPVQSRESDVPTLPQSSPAAAASADALPSAMASPGSPAVAASVEPTAVALAQPDTVRTSEILDDAEALRQADRYIGTYDGGPCVFVAAVRLASGIADIDALAPATEPFGMFNQGFLAATGFEPAVTGQKVWSPQCPAVNFLRRVRGEGGLPPKLRLDTISVKAGEPLHGSIEDPSRRVMHLFLVSETGALQDLSASLVPTNTGDSFTLTTAAGNAAGPVPQLLIAVAGDATPPNSASDGTKAAAFFDAWATAAEQSRASLSATAKLFLRRD